MVSGPVGRSHSGGPPLPSAGFVAARFQVSCTACHAMATVAMIEMVALAFLPGPMGQRALTLPPSDAVLVGGGSLKHYPRTIAEIPPAWN